MTRDVSQSFLARLWRHATPLDFITIGYIALFGLGIIAFGRDHGSWKILLTVHLR